jgi:hypothetical protein
MTMSISPDRRWLAILAGAALPVTLLVAIAGAGPSSGSEPATETLTATLDVVGDGGGRDVVVTTEPDLGRVEVSPYFWPTNEGGRYLHVGLGTFDGDGCQVHRWVVVDTTDMADSAAYDATGEPVPQTEQFTVPAEWTEQVTRIGIAPFAAVDCVRSASYASSDPISHGTRIWTAPAHSLVPVDFTDVPGSFPASVTCPHSIERGTEFPVTVSLDPAPGAAPGAGVIPQPSHLSTLGASVDPGAFSVVSTPEMPQDVDLWKDAPWSGDFVLDADDAAAYNIRLRGSLTRNDVTTAWSCGKVPVTVPAPIGWSGTLAGTTWWQRGLDSNSSIGNYQVHTTYQFLDDAWVYVDGEYGGPRTEPCTQVAAGCHRYYYDEASEQLQIDDRLAKPGPDGWLMPEGHGYVSYPSDHRVLPVESGQRFRYAGTGLFGGLRLHRDGTYRFHGYDPDGGSGVLTWSGSYRFVGGTAQELVLHHDGRTFRDGVALFFGDVEGHQRLRDLDTHHRQFRFRDGQ